MSLLNDVATMNLTTKWNYFFQVVGTVGQVCNLLLPVVADEYKPIVTGVIAVLQGIVALKAHKSNPDGTPASVAYDGKK